MLILTERTAAFASLGTLTVENSAQASRQDMFVRTVPCPQGAVTLASPIVVTGSGTGFAEQAQWRPFYDAIGGTYATWPDGSIKIARIAFPVLLQPNEILAPAVSIGTGRMPAFEMHAAVAAALPNLVLELEVEGQLLRLSGYEVLENGPRYEMRRYVARFPITAGAVRQFVWQVDVMIPSGMRHLRFWARPINSYAKTHPTNPTTNSEYPEGQFQITQPIRMRFGPAADWNVHLEFEQEWTMGRTLDGNGNWQFTVMDTSVLTQDFQRQYPDGTAPIFSGVLYCESGAAFTAIETSTAQAESTRHWPSGHSGAWVSTGLANPNYGGVVPPIPAWFETEAEALQALRAFGASQDGTTVTAAPGSKNNSSHSGMEYSPGRTGAQAAFARIMCWPEYRVASSARLRAMKRSAYHDSWRPMHFREWNTLRVVEAADHPRCVFNGSRPLFNGPNARSEDMLGKHTAEGTEQNSEVGQFGAPGTRVTGHDLQHYAHGYVTHTAQITGDWGLMCYLEDLAEKWIFAHPYNSGNPSLDGLNAARAVDRGYDTGSHVFHLTGRNDIRTRLSQRIDHVVTEWSGDTSQVRVLQYARGDNRGGEQKYHPADPNYVASWGEGMAVGGLMAAYAVTGNPEARRMAKAISREVVMYMTQDRSTVARQVIKTNNLFLVPGRGLPQPGDIYIERDVGGTEVARGIYVGEQHDAVLGFVHLRDCSALFPARPGASIENLRDPNCNQVIRSKVSWQIGARMWWNGGERQTAAQLDIWDAEGIAPNGQPPYTHFDNPQFTGIQWADNTDFLYWAASAYAYGVEFATEDNDAAWLARCLAVIEYLKPKVADRPPGFGWDSMPQESAHQFLALPNVWTPVEPPIVPIAYPEDFTCESPSKSSSRLRFHWTPSITPGVNAYVIKLEHYENGHLVQDYYLFNANGGQTNTGDITGLQEAEVGGGSRLYDAYVISFRGPDRSNDSPPIEGLYTTGADFTAPTLGAADIAPTSALLQIIRESGDEPVLYRLQYKLASNPLWTGAEESEIDPREAQTSPSVYRHMIDGLTRASAYNARVRGESDADLGPWSNQENFTTLP